MFRYRLPLPPTICGVRSETSSVLAYRAFSFRLALDAEGEDPESLSPSTVSEGDEASDAASSGEGGALVGGGARSDRPSGSVSAGSSGTTSPSRIRSADESVVHPTCGDERWSGR